MTKTHEELETYCRHADNELARAYELISAFTAERNANREEVKTANNAAFNAELRARAAEKMVLDLQNRLRWTENKNIELANTIKSLKREKEICSQITAECTAVFPIMSDSSRCYDETFAVDSNGFKRFVCEDVD